MKKILYGSEITWTTLLGIIKKEFPLSAGNCFSLKCDGKEYRIVNFYLENLKKLLELGLTFPIRLKKLTACVALIDDERISNKWYRTKCCETCCPDKYLPVTQKWKLIGKYE